MTREEVNAFVFYRHRPEEVEELSKAVIPLAEHIKAVDPNSQGKTVKNIVHCRLFRKRDVVTATNLLRRACAHARMHLDDYFPYMRRSVVANVEHLEDAIDHYMHTWEYAYREATPVH